MPSPRAVLAALLPLALAAAGTALAVGGVEMAATALGSPFWMVPFVTSIATVIGLPEAAPAQPRAFIGGHLLSSLVGYAVLAAGGSGTVAAAVAVGLAVALMKATRTTHPPAGIDPFLVVNEGLGPHFLLVTVGGGALLLAVFAYAWNNGVARRRWPTD